MKIKIRKKEILGITVFLMMLMQILIVRWLNYTMRFSYIFILVFVLHLFIHFKGYIKIKNGLLFSSLLIIYFVYSASGNRTIGMQNFKLFFPSVCALLFISYMIKLRDIELRKLLFKSAAVLNIYYLLNVPVLMMELGGNIALAGKHSASAINPMLEDLICGLFGYNGTPILGLFTSFMTVYNLEVLKNMRRKIYRNIFIVYNVLMFVFMLWISTKNDNKSSFIMILSFYIVYAFCEKYKKTGSQIVSKTIGIFKQLIVALVGVGIVYSILMKFEGTRRAITLIITRINDGISLGGSATGSAERIGAIVYILNDYSHRLFGYGLGSHTWRQGNAFGFYHFGQNDLSVFLILGGIVFLILVLCTIYFCLYDAVESKFMALVFVMLFLLLITATQVVTEFSSMFIYLLFVALCCLKYKE